MKLRLTWLTTLFMAFIMQLTFAQLQTVSGTITDEIGLPLPGATVLIKGTSTGTSADFDGNYSINANSGQVLEFSYIGYATQSITVGISNTIDVQLTLDTTLDEVLVVAYGQTTLKTNAASIATLKTEKIENRANVAVLQSLQGQVAGVNVGTGSGQPGGDSFVVIRGIGSVNSETEPLYLIDGIPTNRDNFRTINPNDIATFTVLKDASATSLYGNRGSNGVILITTKKGRFNEGIKIQYSTSFGWSDLQPSNVELMNSTEILNLQRFYDAGDGAGLTDGEIAAIAAQSNTNWFDVFFRTASTNSHNLSITSGGENSRNFTSLQYVEQDGILFNTDFKRISVRNNFSGKSSNDKFTYDLNLALSYSKTNEQDGTGSNATFFNPFRAPKLALPYLSPFDLDGSQTIDGGVIPGVPGTFTGSNIKNFIYVLLNSMSLNTDIEEDVRILGNFNANWEFADNLTAGMSIGVDYRSERRTEILHPASILGPFQSEQGNLAAFGGIWESTNTRDVRTTTLTSLNYNNTFDEKHDVDVSLFLEYNRDFIDISDFDQDGLDERFLGSGNAFIPANTQETINGVLVNPYLPFLNVGRFTTGLFSYFGKLNYTYDSKYGIQASFRRDASFRFSDDNKWGTFWSIAGRWNIDEENFMANSSINLLKLRASYGTVGNQLVGSNVIGGFALPTNYRGLSVATAEVISGAGYNSTVSLIPNAANLGNPDLRWEITKATNFGVDFGVWNNRLSGSLDVYERITSDLFFSRNISLINPGTTIDSNVGKLQNKGIELQLDYTILDKDDWRISVGATGSYNENEITELAPETNGRIIDGSLTPLAEGEAFGTYFLNRFAGVNPSNGESLFLDIDGNLTEQLIPDNDVFLDKSSQPTWQGGFYTDIKYKGFELSTQWSFVADVYRVNLDFAELEDTSSIGDGQNRSPSILGAWQNPGDITDIPRVGAAQSGFGLAVSSDRYLEDSSYLRMRNVQLAYIVPAKFLENTPFTNIKFYFQGENLLTFTKFRGRDPESNFRAIDRGQFPTSRIVSLGADINF